MPKEERIIVEGMHEALVDKETFDIVQDMIKSRFYVRCNTYACNTHLHLCTPHSNNLEKLTNYVLEQVKARCKEFLDENKYMNVANSSKDKILKGLISRTKFLF